MTNAESNHAYDEKSPSPDLYNNYISNDGKDGNTVAPNSAEVSSSKNDLWHKSVR